jgi:hypothetical protein
MPRVLVMWRTNAERPHEAACGTTDPIISYFHRPDVRAIPY